MALVDSNSAAGNGKEVSEVVEANLYLESVTFVTSETLHVDGGARRSVRPRCVGLPRARDLGLGAEVEKTGARKPPATAEQDESLPAR
jgi:hypothetical protein